MSNFQFAKPKNIIELEKKLNIVITAGGYSKDNEHHYVQNADGQVVELHLHGIDGKYLPNLVGFNSLVKLSLEHSSFTNITFIIKLAQNLEYLSLAGNQNLEQIWEIGRLTKLKHLDISKTKVWDLSPLYDLLQNSSFKVTCDYENIIYPQLLNGSFTSQESMVVWFKKHYDLANSIIDECYVAGSKTIDLGFCGITDLTRFPQLFQCTHLEELILSNEYANYNDNSWYRVVSSNANIGYPNNIFRIPNKLKLLKNLKRIYCSGDWKTEDGKWNRWRLRYFRIFTKLTQLEFLNVSNNEVNNIYRLDLLQNLKTLHANNNNIKEVSVNGELPQMTELFISNNFIQDVSFLNYCPNITTIDLHSNQLKNLQNIRNLIQRLQISDSKWALKTIGVAENKKLRLPPLDVIANGMDAVMDYFNRWEQEQELDLPLVINNDIKVILVGNSGVGKTTLALWLTSGGKKLNQLSTTWFNRIPWQETINGRKYNLRLFDFGGQEYYHDTHYLFFTQDAIYLTLWDNNPYELTKIGEPGNELIGYPVEYWLDSISYFTGRRKIASGEAQVRKLVLEKEKLQSGNVEVSSQILEDESSKKNQERNTLVFQSKVDTYKNIEFLNQQKLSRKYGWIADFSNFSVKEDRGLKHVKDKIFELIDDMPIIQRPLLGTWGAIKEHIEKHGNKRKNELTIRRFQNYCNKVIRQMPELETASKQKIDRLVFNRQNTISFIQYLSTIGLVLYFPENKELADRVFINQNYLVEHIHNILLQLAQKNGVIEKSEITATKPKVLNEKEIQTLINVMTHFKIVFSHPVKTDLLIAPLYLPSKPLSGIQLFLSQFKKPLFRYQFKGFIHRSVVLEFFSSFGSKILNGGLDNAPYYFWKNGVVLKDNVSEEIILVSFNNDNDSKEYKGYIDVCSLTGKKGNFSDEVLIALDSITKDRNVDKAVFASNGNCVPLKDIIEAAELQHYVFKYNHNYYKLVDFKEYLDKPLKMKNLFISYSKDDLTMVDEFKKHLSALQRDGKVGHWYCTELIAGEEWNASIQRHFEESDIICFMVSPNFMHTDYIFEYEIKKALERKKTEPQLKIVPIILDFCRWTTEKYNLGTYTALPYTAKPVSDFPNKNMAWYIVAEALRVMIDDDKIPPGAEFYTSERLPKDVQEIYRRISRKEIS
ncbi:TIR domain-containing protein [Taibaiella lutea]|uniref:TIR domain-containing protein n=1 Tax=Taibaiella lutea TaxID=2608001 RepID=A0A5M6CII8_9BACT|nr:COR domain-containing protein [Taibaiella lutea]KAA5534924.1 TIR domain-containing protein [Taibaiella lutea]